MTFQSDWERASVLTTRKKDALTEQERAGGVLGRTAPMTTLARAPGPLHHMGAVHAKKKRAGVVYGVRSAQDAGRLDQSGVSMLVELFGELGFMDSGRPKRVTAGLVYQLRGAEAVR